MATKTKPASRPTSTTRKTKGAKASGKAKKGRALSEPSSRAKGLRSAATRAKIAKDSPASDKPKHIGRPKDSASVWTPAHIAEVADLMWRYIEDTPIPLVSEFCAKYHVRFQRLGEFPELAEMREALQAKMAAATTRAGLALKQGEGPKGAFIAKLSANTGSFSLVEKLETENKNTTVNEYEIPNNGRGAKGRG